MLQIVLTTFNTPTSLCPALLSRQFVEMTRPRIEGLLAAFPKLMASGKQHTFVETESVRLVRSSMPGGYLEWVYPASLAGCTHYVVGTLR